MLDQETGRPNLKPEALRKAAAVLAISSALIMIVGAILLAASGADLDGALAEGSMDAYLRQAAGARSILVANLSVWIVGVVLWGAAGTLISRLSAGRPAAALLGRYCFSVGVPLVVAAYVAWLTIVVQLTGGDSAVSLKVGEALGWFASRGDWVATILVVGLGPALVASGGAGTWAPRWLVIWGYLAAATGFLNAIAMLTGGAGLLTYGFLIIPVGVGWMIAAGVVLLRRPGSLRS